MTFRKFNYGHTQILDWPMTQADYDALGETGLVSPRAGNDHGYTKLDQAEVIEQMKELPDLREKVETGIWPTEYLEKYLDGRGDLSPILAKYLGLSAGATKKAADTVRMDHPFDIWDIVVAPYAKDNNIPLATPVTHQGVDFVESVVRRAEAHQIVAKALDKSFDVKYAFGSCRPIEYYDCEIQRYMTPTHPEMPAGHGAFAGAGSKAFEKIYAPTAEQAAEMQYATKQFAMYRSFSGMHIPYSNLLGWKIGYES